MARVILRSVAVLLCVVMLTTPICAAQSDTLSQQITRTASGLSAKDGKVGTLLGMHEDFPAGTSVCDWVAMALALSGSREAYAAYLASLENYVEECYRENGKLDRIKSTPYHRIALTVLALNGDPQNFGTHPDGTPIDLIADGTYAFAGDSIGAQGLNGWVYALLTLDASKATVPENAKFSREDMIDAIVSAQEPDGGFGLAKGSSNVDITAMALQALAPYADAYPQVIDGGLRYLSEEMSDECLYTYFGAESVESSAQTVLALCALGIDPDTDPRFQRGANTLLTAIARFRQNDGTYGHTLEDKQGDYLATAQTLLALLAVQKLRTTGEWIFDFTGHTLPEPITKNSKDTIIIVAVAAIAVAAASAGILMIRKREQYGKSNG